MIVLPATVQRWMVHHPVLPVLALVATNMIVVAVVNNWVAPAIGLLLYLAAGTYMGIEWGALKRHDARTCERCDETVANRKAAVLRSYHRLTPVVLAGWLGVLLLLVAMTMQAEVWWWGLTGFLLPAGAWLWLAYGALRHINSTHVRLRLWCPWCGTSPRHARTRQSVI